MYAALLLSLVAGSMAFAGPKPPPCLPRTRCPFNQVLQNGVCRVQAGGKCDHRGCKCVKGAEPSEGICECIAGLDEEPLTGLCLTPYNGSCNCDDDCTQGLECVEGSCACPIGYKVQINDQEDEDKSSHELFYQSPYQCVLEADVRCDPWSYEGNFLCDSDSYCNYYTHRCTAYSSFESDSDSQSKSESGSESESESGEPVSR